MAAHRYPKDAPAEVLAWKCDVCGQWQHEGKPATECDGDRD